jgi:hypothetical protein
MDSWTYGGSSTDYLYGAVETSDGGHMLIGSTCSYGAGYSDYWLVKVDAHGTLIWNKTYGGPYTDMGCSILSTPDGNYLLFGFSAITNATGMEECTDGWIIKVDTDGNVLWDKKYGLPADADYSLGGRPTSDGGYLVAGATYPNTSTTELAWLFKIDADGNMQWSKTYGDTGKDCFWGMTPASDGGFTLTGQTYVGGSDELWLLKIDTDGNLLWNKTYGGAYSELGFCIINAPDGGYVVSGTTASFGSGKNDMWFLKTDANGEMQWNQTFGGAEDDYGYVSTHLADGGYAVVGSTMSFGAGSADFWLIRTNSNGGMLWNQTLGGPDFDEGQSVYVTPNGVYTIVGTTTSFGSGSIDGWLIETNAFDQTTTAQTQNGLTVQLTIIAVFTIVSVLVGVAAALLKVKNRKESVT